MWVLPGFIDCHSHLVWAGDRSAEYELRLSGISYSEIARQGGGILSTVRSTRAATKEELVKDASLRLADLQMEGVTTQEIKSGYGLDLETETKMLHAIHDLQAKTNARIISTYLCAHALPPEFAGRSDDYVDWICSVGLPTIWKSQLAKQADVFCEKIAFSPHQCRRILHCAKSLGFDIKVHADQLSDLGGGAISAEFHGLSADHLEFVNATTLDAMAKANTVAVILPGAYFALGDVPIPPIRLMRERGLSMAIATDCNPGTSPFPSLNCAMNLACWEFGLTPAEAIAGVTKHAARALGIHGKVGQIRVGMDADLALFAIHHPRELAITGLCRRCRYSWSRGNLIIGPN